MIVEAHRESAVGRSRSRDGPSAASPETLGEVTGQRQAETDLRLLAAELDRRVTERTLELETTTRALDAERTRLARLLERLPEGIVAVGVDGRIEYANAAAASMLGDDVASVGAALPERWNGVELARRVDELCARAERSRPLAKAVQIFVRDVELADARELLARLEDAGAQSATFVLTEEKGADAVRRLAVAVL